MMPCFEQLSPPTLSAWLLYMINKNGCIIIIDQIVSVLLSSDVYRTPFVWHLIVLSIKIAYMPEGNAEFN